MPIFYVLLGIMIAELLAVFSGCCLTAMKKRSESNVDRNQPLLLTIR